MTNKPKFKLLRNYVDWPTIVDCRWLHWEMVSGDPIYYPTHPHLRGKRITPGSVVSLTDRAFWGGKND